ncbi:MAG: heavy-metal-associated domain-containing protein [Clostridiales bacterium]|nr:heavy-metal-associated domain-containing protein [Clostridia bacterium]MBQ1313616.1 heavy-metal-associated domain-containing protein [Clostridia bacterium]MBR1826775.1 heavy-metal-associated domain-containing protein [Clostridia bacterium]NLD29442.1 heavy-metal-associated domain-containing protein [Clostridiales bacterium]
MHPWKARPLMKTYKIYVDCANCAAKMEEAIKKTEGIADATVNFMALKMNVEFEEGADEKKVLKKALKNARKVDDDIEIEF